MANYDNGKIYKLVSRSTGLVYYGSTVQTLKARLSAHKKDFKNYNKGIYNYVSSFKVLEQSDYLIELVTDYPCNDEKELLWMEGFFIKNYKCVNKQVAGRGKKQYREDNKDKIAEQKKQRYEENIEDRHVKSRMYYRKNKEAVLERSKKRYQKNKDKISEKVNEKFTCDCGGKYTYTNKAKHEQTKKHQDFISKK